MTFRELRSVDVIAFVKEQRREDLMLDFKLAPAAFANRDDRKTLTVAVSGFANSSGGLIVWGVDARQDDDGIDCAQRVEPIADPSSSFRGLRNTRQAQLRQSCLACCIG